MQRGRWKWQILRVDKQRACKMEREETNCAGGRTERETSGVSGQVV